MSLVNKMLEDLKERDARSAASAGTAVSGLRPARHPPAGRRPVAWAIAGSLFVVSLSAWLAIGGGPENATADRLPPVSAKPEPGPPEPLPPADAANAYPEARPIEAAVFLDPPFDESEWSAASSHRESPESRIREPFSDRGEIHKTRLPASWEELAEATHREALDLADHGQLEEAVAALRRLLGVDPGRTSARENLAAILVDAGHLEDARIELEAGLALDPDSSSLAKRLARVLVDGDRIPEALSILEGAAPALEHDVEYHAFLAALYQRTGRDDRAARLYAGVLRRAPEHAHWWMGLGISLERQGHPRDARRVYETAIAVGGLGAAPRRFVGERIAALKGQP